MKRTAANYFIMLVLIVVSGACSKIDFEGINNLNDGRIDVLGHGGAGFQSLINPYPSNSFLSITYAIDAQNADGLEVDVQISNDSILMLYHDVTLERSTSCFGCVNQLPASVLEDCRFYNQYGAQVLKEAYLDRFSRVLDHFKDRARKPKIYLNLKIDNHCIDMSNGAYMDLWATIVTRIIKQYNAYSWVAVYDGDVILLNKIRALDPAVEICFNAQGYNEAIEKCRANNIKTIVIGNTDINKEQVTEAHSEGIRIIIWGLVNRKAMVDAINKSPDGLMTDNIPLAQECLQN